jgi:hypothetical protein
MLERPVLTPPLGATGPLTSDHLATHFRQWRADVLGTVERLQTLRRGAEESSSKLENPKAAAEYVEFFADWFGRVVADLDALLAELPAGFTEAHADLLRQIASNAAAEMRRTVMFRDKWVNKPLPYDEMRPLLTQLANDVRDQLNDLKEMTLAAARLGDLIAPPTPLPQPVNPETGSEQAGPTESSPGARGFDRRALFKRIVRPGGSEPEG